MTNLTITYSVIAYQPPAPYIDSPIRSRSIEIYRLSKEIRATQTILSRLQAFRYYNGVDYLSENIRALIVRLMALHNQYFKLLPPPIWEEDAK